VSSYCPATQDHNSAHVRLSFFRAGRKRAMWERMYATTHTRIVGLVAQFTLSSFPSFLFSHLDRAGDQRHVFSLELSCIEFATSAKLSTLLHVHPTFGRVPGQDYAACMTKHNLLHADEFNIRRIEQFFQLYLDTSGEWTHLRRKVSPSLESAIVY